MKEEIKGRIKFIAFTIFMYLVGFASATFDNTASIVIVSTIMFVIGLSGKRL